MGRLFRTIIGVFMASYQLQRCVGFDIVSLYSTASGAAGFGETCFDVMALLIEDGISVEELTVSIENLNRKIQDDMTHILEALKDLPSNNLLESNEETLKDHFDTIGQCFEEASRLKKEFVERVVQRTNDRYQKFALQEEDIDRSIYKIRRILTDDSTIFVLKQNFIETSKKFDNVCSTGMSQLQLLGSLLGNLKLVTVQYYLSKIIMYELLHGGANLIGEQTLLKNVSLDYSNGVRKFEDIMSSASLELWKCDPLGGYNDTVRNTDQIATDFAELRICPKCDEDDYFVEDRVLESDIDSNKVITGARLVVEDNVLRLQIQQAKLMAYGIVDKATIEWVPLPEMTEEEDLYKISFDDYKKFALTPVMNTDGGVLINIGMSADKEDKIINLYAGFADFAFATGALNGNSSKTSYSDDPTQQYNMTNRDASTKSKKENKPDSTDEQFVELTITDLSKDGGKSVVPFIDTQNVTANGPLSGASLYIRGQPGFGGFLALKLYTFDTRKYVHD